MIKRVIRSAAVWPWRILPRPLRQSLLKGGLYASASAEPRTALAELLEIDAVVSGQIDLASLRYGDGVHVKHRLMAYHDFFVSRIRPDERVLDVGCGYGAVANSIADRARAQVVGIDLNPSNIDHARKRFTNPGLRFAVGEAPRDLPNEPFDVIVLSNVLEHVEHRVAFLAALTERARPQRILIRVPMADRHWHVPLRRELGLFHFSDPTHFTEYTRQSFEDEMRDAHLAITHCQVNWGEIWAEVTPRA